jgi:hypothetical protein
MRWRSRDAAVPSDPVCARCSKPVTPGTAAQRAGRPVHVRCLAGETVLTSIEQQDQAAETRRRAAAERLRAAELVNTVRRSQTHCPVCREPFGMSRNVLSQGDKLVHAACWRSPDRPAAS